MSTFVRTIDAYCERFGVTPRDRRRLLLRYPFFKASWLSVYGGRSRGLARRLTDLLGSYRFSHEVDGARGRLRVPVSFEPHDLASFREIFFGGEYDAPFDLSRATTAVDLGANTGMAALYLLTRAPLEKLVLVEANPGMLDGLRGALAGPIAEGVAVVEHACAVGAPRDAMRFFVPSDHRMARMLDGEAPAERGTVVEVPARTLSQVLDAHGLATADVLKIDIEGAEHDLLAGDEAAFARFEHIFAEVHGDARTRQAWVERVCALGFEIARRPGADNEGSETLALMRGA